MAEIDLTKRVVYGLEGTVRPDVKRDVAYREDGGAKLLMDVYSMPSLAPGTRLPAVLFVHGGPVPKELSPKDWGVFQSYAELVVAFGVTGVALNHRLNGPNDYPQSQADIAAAVEYLRAHAEELHVDPERISLWYFSGGGPLMSWVLRERPAFVRCVLAFYALLDLRHMLPPESDAALVRAVAELSPAALVRTRSQGLPLFVARAGRDAAFINQAIDLFVAEALAANAMIDVANHPDGQHSFDVLDDDDRSREIIDRALRFLQAHA